MTTTLEDVTDAYRDAYNAEREELYPEGLQLELIERKPGVADVPLATVTDGWLPRIERNRGQVEGTATVYVIEQAPVTQDIINRANRVRYGGVEYVSETHDDPIDAPRQWVLYCSELKAGALR